jgi:hypothetical protein
MSAKSADLMNWESVWRAYINRDRRTICQLQPFEGLICDLTATTWQKHGLKINGRWSAGFVNELSYLGAHIQKAGKWHNLGETKQGNCETYKSICWDICQERFEHIRIDRVFQYDRNRRSVRILEFSRLEFECWQALDQLCLISSQQTYSSTGEGVTFWMAMRKWLAFWTGDNEITTNSKLRRRLSRNSKSLSPPPSFKKWTRWVMDE